MSGSSSGLFKDCVGCEADVFAYQISPLTLFEFLGVREAYHAKPLDLDTDMFCNQIAVQLNKQRALNRQHPEVLSGTLIMAVLRKTHFELQDRTGGTGALAKAQKSLLEEADIAYCAAPVIVDCPDCKCKLTTRKESNRDVFFYPVDFERGHRGQLFARDCPRCKTVFEVDGYYRPSNSGMKFAYSDESLENPRWERLTRQTVVAVQLFKMMAGSLHFQHSSFEGFVNLYNYMRGPRESAASDLICPL